LADRGRSSGSSDDCKRTTFRSRDTPTIICHNHVAQR
jgi:hypothetical protein